MMWQYYLSMILKLIAIISGIFAVINITKMNAKIKKWSEENNAEERGNISKQLKKFFILFAICAISGIIGILLS